MPFLAVLDAHPVVSLSNEGEYSPTKDNHADSGCAGEATKCDAQNVENKVSSSTVWESSGHADQTVCGHHNPNDDPADANEREGSRGRTSRHPSSVAAKRRSNRILIPAGDRCSLPNEKDTECGEDEATCNRNHIKPDLSSRKHGDR